MHPKRLGHRDCGDPKISYIHRAFFALSKKEGPTIRAFDADHIERSIRLTRFPSVADRTHPSQTPPIAVHSGCKSASLSASSFTVFVSPSSNARLRKSSREGDCSMPLLPRSRWVQ